MSLRNCLVVVWVYVVYVVGTCLFLSGYLLKHHIVYQNSTLDVSIGNSISCDDFTSLHNLYEEFIHDLEISDINEEKKNYLQRFDKAVIIIIDALRYDFVNNSISNHRDEEFYLNKMPVFKQMVKKFPQNSVLLPLFADPPTTTSQRLKGITTGSLPTFIDISENFASSEIIEDNFIRQLNRLNKRIVFMGDDTWDNIFPGHFTRSYFYPSFNVKDLDTVDNGILDNIYKEIEHNNTDVLIAHFLGVDHCGHRYGPKHPEMTRKLLQMNSIILKIIESLRKNTILFVLGDHGMTNTGDHGGDSAKETSTALFLYSPSKIVYHSKVHNLQTVAQIDIVPTLSLLLGLPIPFSNLGSVIPHLFSLNHYCFSEKIDNSLGGALATAENALQVHRYLKAYSFQTNEFDNLFVMDVEEKLRNISYLWKSITRNITHNLEVISKIQIGFEEYTHYIYKLFEKKWATFNYECMTLGLFLLCSAVAFNIFTAEQISKNYIIFILSSVAFIFVHVMLFIFYSDHFLFPIIFMCSIFLMFMIYFKSYFFQCVLNLFSIQSLILLILFLCSFSNSFVIYEDRVTLYLLQSVILYRYIPFVVNFFKHTFQTCKNKSYKQNQKMNFVEPLLLVCLMFCIRLGSVFFKCREEQVSCVDSNFILSLEKLHIPQSQKILRLFLSLTSVIFPVVMFLYLSNYKSSTKVRTATGVSIRYGIFFVCVFTSLRWWLNIVSPEAVEKILKGNEVMLTRSAVFMIVTMSIILVLFPILSEKPWTLPSKEIYCESLGSLMFIVSQLLYLIAGDAVSSAITLMSASLLLYAILSDLSTKAGEIINQIWIDGSQIWIDVLIWNLSSRYWFYASAHQATFSSVQWDAAFLLNHKEIYSYTLSCILVIINTFASNILHGLALPAILISSQSTACSTTSIRRLYLKYMFCFGIKLLGHATAALILRRHLMAWKIFSPRLLYEVMGTLITMAASCIGHFFILSVVSQYHKQIRKNLGHMFSDKNE